MLRLLDLSFLDWKPVHLELTPGSCTGIVGESGSGKSLLLRAIADLDPHLGDCEWRGELCQKMPAPTWRSRVGLLPAESAWWFDTVGAHFSPASQPGDLLTKLGFPADVLNWEVHRLSAGERQRLALTRLLVRTPEVLLLDEPTANLDEAATLLIEEIIAEYRSRHQAPVLWVSHSAAQLQRIADRVFKMEARELTEVTGT